MLKKFCRCGKIISQDIKMCNECEAKFNKDKKKSYKTYKTRRTDTKEQSIYSNNKDWKLTRKAVMNRDNGMCKLCENKHSDVVHHIEPLKESWSKRFNMSNLICLCNRCHYYVHKKYDKEYKSKVEMQDKLSKLINEKN